MKMTEDQVDTQVEESSSQEGGSFGEIATREEESGDVRLAKDSVVEKTTDPAETEEVVQEDDTQETEQEAENKEEGEDEYTEKGTKLDKNPQSRVHQELANERKIRGQMEAVLSNPELLTKFLKQQYNVEVQAPKAEEPVVEEEVKEYKPEDFENIDDVAKVVNGIQKSFVDRQKGLQQEVEGLKNVVERLVSGARSSQIASIMGQDVNTLKQEPELTPGNTDFIPDLEKMIVEQYHKLDFDPATQSYAGRYSLQEVGMDIIKAVREGKKVGSQKAQTIVKKAGAGKIKTSSSTSDGVDTARMTPANSIASGIAKMFGN